MKAKKISDIRIITMQKEDGTGFVVVQGNESNRTEIENCAESGVAWSFAVLRALQSLGAFKN